MSFVQGSRHLKVNNKMKLYKIYEKKNINNFSINKIFHNFNESYNSFFKSSFNFRSSFSSQLVVWCKEPTFFLCWKMFPEELGRLFSTNNGFRGVSNSDFGFLPKLPKVPKISLIVLLQLTFFYLLLYKS